MPIKKKKVDEKNKLTYARLAARARKVGRRASTGINSKMPTVEVTGSAKHRSGYLRRISKKKLTSKKFGGMYRRTQAGADELVSTSTVREFLNGIIEHRGFIGQIKGKKWRSFERSMENLSKIRIPTKYSGYSLEAGYMQHPTSRGLFGSWKKKPSARQHRKLDMARSDYVLKAMSKALDADKTFDEVTREGVRAAIEFTLNTFTAPVAAENVQPFSEVADMPLDDMEIQNQMLAREQMKAAYILLGGRLRDEIPGETAAGSLRRRWEQGDINVVQPPSPRRGGISLLKKLSP